ncbi:hypothetical protein GCM10011290_29250 [Vogesella alkaliphila]|uniref:Uncharacterized protein n=1 Tax=Vogesella alkaliphila TaxID=1193621 RepID=A0ABQ2YYH3_9NEIS|nr:hypothetical protein GCM10011290_29250 [Vogesella alkaliphila]
MARPDFRRSVQLGFAGATLLAGAAVTGGVVTAAAGAGSTLAGAAVTMSAAGATGAAGGVGVESGTVFFLKKLNMRNG